MNSERALAYGRAIKALDDLSATKLHADEQQIVREAADALFFCEDLAADPAAEVALNALYELSDRLIEGDRLLPETAGRLVADVEACGPFVAVG